jgi:ethanolamine ammonia-lyase small subunit
MRCEVQLGECEGAQVGDILLGKRPGLDRQIAQEVETCGTDSAIFGTSETSA